MGLLHNFIDLIRDYQIIFYKIKIYTLNALNIVSINKKHILCFYILKN